MEDYGSEKSMIDNHVNLCKKLGVDKPTILDVGANHGLVSMEYCKSFDGGELSLFEPNRNLLKDIEGNLSEFNVDWKIQVNQIIVSSDTDIKQLNIAQDDGVSSLLEVEAELLTRNPDAYLSLETIDVESTTLDLYCESNVPQSNLIDILKIDTQGNDLDVLTGAENLLKENKINIIGCELYFAKAYIGQCKPHQVMSYLDSFGYHLFSFDRLSHTEKNYLYFGDATFVSNNAWNKLGGF